MVGGRSAGASLRAGILLLLVAAAPALAAGTPFQLDRLGAYDILASPGDTVWLPARLTNGGSGPDSYPLSGFASNTSGGWLVATPGAPRLEPGGQRTLDASLGVPLAGGVSMISLRACAHSAPASCRDVSWRVSTPPAVTLAMPPSFSSLSPVTGSVSVKWLNGAPVANMPVRVMHQTTPVAITTTEQFQTDADGRVDFTLESPLARTPGRHLVFVEVQVPTLAPSTARGSYNVGIG